VQAFATDPQALFSSKRWYLRAPDGPGVPPPPLLRVTHAREQGAWIVASAQEVPDRNAAEALKGARVFIARSSFPTAGSDEFYWVDLIGCAVVNREGVELGSVADLMDTGVHSVLRVVQGDDAERLIPFVAAYVDAVDLAARRITVDWGLDF
jgi:16S rRNA processing protein RimM